MILQAGIIRLIGDPETRYREDPVRMLRAVRFAAKLDMTINAATAEPIPRLASLLRIFPRQGCLRNHSNSCRPVMANPLTVCCANTSYSSRCSP